MQGSNSCQVGTRSVSKGNELRERLKNAKDFTRRDWWGMEGEVESKVQGAYFSQSNGVEECDRYSRLSISILEASKLRLRRINDRSKPSWDGMWQGET